MQLRDTGTRAPSTSNDLIFSVHSRAAENLQLLKQNTNIFGETTAQKPLSDCLTAAFARLSLQMYLYSASAAAVIQSHLDEATRSLYYFVSLLYVTNN